MHHECTRRPRNERAQSPPPRHRRRPDACSCWRRRPAAARRASSPRLLEREPGIRLSVSYTTRAPRPGEDRRRPLSLRRRAALSRAQGQRRVPRARLRPRQLVCDVGHVARRGGRSRATTCCSKSTGRAREQVRRLIPEAVHIFILPPSLALLRERLEKRGQDSPEVILRRLEAAREEMRHCGEFDYVIMNQDFARAVDDLCAIVRAARLTAPRQQVRHAQLLQRLLEN